MEDNSMSNGNWVRDREGWHKKTNSTTRGNADYFKRPIPPVRDGATGHPIGKNGKVDWKRVIREANNK
jgi:hypothetical protein